MRVEGFLRESLRRFPDKIALVAGEVRLTYREFASRVARLAQELRARGVQRGDRVVVFQHNCADAAVAIFGVLEAGAVFSPLHPSTKADKLAYVLNHSGARAIITEPRLAKVANEAADQAPGVAVRLVTPFPGGEAELQQALSGIELDLAMVVYTSGSTGKPKGVTMTHANIVAAATSITTYLESKSDDVVLSVLPLSFDYGLYQLLMCVKMGATLVLEKSFTYPAVLLKKLEAENVTGLPLVPTIAAVLLQLKLTPGMFPKLRYLTNTAAALPRAHIERLRELFPHAKLFSMYGLTECKRCTYLPPEQLNIRPESVGIAIPGTEAYVVDEHGRRTAPGQVGELVIRGPHVMKGYWNDPQATDKALKPGPFPWEKVLYTGDLFRTDDEGFLYFVGRKDDIIKSRGEKVAPREVENVLYELPGVREAAVVGVPDRILGMAIKAVVAVDAASGLNERAVIAHCAARLEEYMVPSQVEFRAELPKSENGKIARRAIAEEQNAEVVA